MKHLTRSILLILLAGLGSGVAIAQGAHQHGHSGHGPGTGEGHARMHDHAHTHWHQDHGHAHTHGGIAGELPRVEAEVRRVNTRANTLSVRHGDIPNLDMPPMTMTFQVRDPALLEGLEVGDHILVTVDRIDGAYTVMSVEAAP